MKYLLLFALLAVVWWLWSKRQAAGSDADRQQDQAPEKMVACEHCGVHMPESEAVVAGNRIYCSEAHRLAAGDTER
jgi:uncharacterized protein